MQSASGQNMTSPNVTIPLEALTREDTHSSMNLGKEPRRSFLQNSNQEAPETLRDNEFCSRTIEKPILGAATARDIMSNKIARRTLKTTIILGIFTVLYYCTSLVPSFQTANAAVQTLQLQKESGDESAQALAFQFLKECTNRKVQKLPLGDDCVKYMRKTPKAPADIDDWVIDPPASNSTSFVLEARDILPGAMFENVEVSSGASVDAQNLPLSASWSTIFEGSSTLATVMSVASTRPLPSDSDPKSGSTPASATTVSGQDWIATQIPNPGPDIPIPTSQSRTQHLVHYSAAADTANTTKSLPGYIFLAFAIALIMILSLQARKIRRLLVNFRGVSYLVYDRIQMYMYEYNTNRLAIYLALGLALLAGLVHLWNFVSHRSEVTAWERAASFLEECIIEKDMGNPVGLDCEKYMSKQLKPRPTLNQTLQRIEIGFALSAGILSLLLGPAAYIMRSLNYFIEVVRDIAQLGPRTSLISDYDLMDPSAASHLTVAPDRPEQLEHIDHRSLWNSLLLSHMDDSTSTVQRMPSSAGSVSSRNIVSSESGLEE